MNRAVSALLVNALVPLFHLPLVQLSVEISLLLIPKNLNSKAMNRATTQTKPGYRCLDFCQTRYPYFSLITDLEVFIYIYSIMLQIDIEATNLQTQVGNCLSSLNDTSIAFKQSLTANIANVKRRIETWGDSLNTTINTNIATLEWMSNRIEDSLHSISNQSAANKDRLGDAEERLSTIQEMVLDLQSEKTMLEGRLQFQNRSLGRLNTRVRTRYQQDREISSLQNLLQETAGMLSSLNTTLQLLKNQLRDDRQKLEQGGKQLMNVSMSHNASLAKLETTMADKLSQIDANLTVLQETYGTLKSRLNSIGIPDGLGTEDRRLKNTTDEIEDQLSAFEDTAGIHFNDILSRFSQLQSRFTSEIESSLRAARVEKSTLLGNISYLTDRIENCSCGAVDNPALLQCNDFPCYPGVQCTDKTVPAKGANYLCGACPTGTYGDGKTCRPLEVGARCYAYGDPHFTTFDSQSHDFQGLCEYVLARDCVGDDFRVHIKNEERRDDGYTWPSAVAIKVSIDNFVIKLWGNRTVIVNNAEVVSLPHELNGVSLSRKHEVVTVKLSHSGLVVRWTPKHFVEVTVPPDYESRMCGLCGQYNGNPRDDLESADGFRQQVDTDTASSRTLKSRSSYHSFGRSWAVEGCDRLLLPSDEPCLDGSSTPADPCAEDLHVESKAREYCSVITDKQGPYRQCHDLVDPEVSYESCVYDVCACRGNRNCTCAVIRVYEEHCRQLGVTSIGTVVDECGVCFGDGRSCQLEGATCQVSGDP